MADPVPADGVVVVQVLPPRMQGERWFSVFIGRARNVKRLNLRESEARQLVDKLSALLP